MITQIFNVYKWITGLKFIWKVARNWSVLSLSLAKISETLKAMHDDSRSLPNATETSEMLLAISNIIKTEIIDVPGVDEYQIALDIDQFSTSLALSIQDTKSGKFHEIVLKKKDK